MLDTQCSQGAACPVYHCDNILMPEHLVQVAPKLCDSSKHALHVPCDFDPFCASDHKRNESLKDMATNFHSLKTCIQPRTIVGQCSQDSQPPKSVRASKANLQVLGGYKVQSNPDSLPRLTRSSPDVPPLSPKHCSSMMSTRMFLVGCCRDLCGRANRDDCTADDTSL